jgi:hypothetical protein
MELLDNSDKFQVHTKQTPRLSVEGRLKAGLQIEGVFGVFYAFKTPKTHWR